MLLGLITFGVVIGGETIGHGAGRAIAPTAVATAQIPAPNLSTSPTDTPAPPPNVERIGDLEVTTVTVRGEALFEIAAPTVIDRDAADDQTPVEVRAQKIQERLRYIISLRKFSEWAEDFKYDTVYDPETLEISVRPLNGQTVLTASDANRTEPQVLLTVTAQDSEYHGVPVQELATEWRGVLQTALTEALRSRQPDALWAWGRFAALLLVALASFSIVSRFIKRRLKHRKQTLQAHQTDEAPDRPHADEINTTTNFSQQLEVLEDIKSYFDLDQRVRWINFFQWLLVWLQIIAWVVGISFIVGRFPLLRFTVQDVLLSPLWVLLIWGTAGLVNRLVDLGINRVATFWRTQNVEGDVKRRSLRISTISNVLKGLSTFLIYLIAILFILETIGFSTRSVLAFGAIIGFAVSLASQNLIRDLVNGFLILIEDQYAIGDVIAVDGVDGFVENLNLRTTQLRNGEGRLIVLPNSCINRVENLTRSWARVDHTVEVAADTNPRRALEVIRGVARDLYDDPEWRSLIVDPPEVLGIDAATHAGLLIRTWIKTEPLQQWAVGREFRLRVLTALDAAGISLGMPQYKLQYPAAANETATHQPFVHHDTAAAHANDNATPGNGVHPTPTDETTADTATEASSPPPR